MQAYVQLHFYRSNGEYIVLAHTLTALKLNTSLVAVYKKKHQRMDLLILFNVVVNTAGIKTTNKIYVSEVRINNNNN